MIKNMSFSELLTTADGKKLNAEETRYLMSLPLIDDDPDFWRHCRECENETKKHIPYVDCASCPHFSRKTLQDIIWSLLCNDLELETNEHFCITEDPDKDNLYRE